jgi:hypothetical protein
MPYVYCVDCPDPNCGAENVLRGRTIEDDLCHPEIRTIVCGMFRLLPSSVG